MSPPGEGVDEEGDDGGGGERAGEVDAGQDVEAGRERCIKKSVMVTDLGPDGATCVDSNYLEVEMTESSPSDPLPPTVLLRVGKSAPGQ